MSAVMLLTVAAGRWLVLPFAPVREIDEGGVARAASLLTGRPVLQDGAEVWSALSGPWLVHPVVLGVALLLLARGLVGPRALLVAPISALGWYLGTVAKGLVERPRPAEAVIEVSSWSYPSGHSTNVALAAVLIVALLGAVRTAWIQWGATALVIIGVALTAADRLLLGVHYPSDVLAGLVMGAAMGLSALAILRPLRASPSGDASPGVHDPEEIPDRDEFASADAGEPRTCLGRCGAWANDPTEMQDGRGGDRPGSPSGG